MFSIGIVYISCEFKIEFATKKKIDNTNCLQ